MRQTSLIIAIVICVILIAAISVLIAWRALHSVRKQPKNSPVVVVMQSGQQESKKTTHAPEVHRINISTRGEIASYQQVGVLYSGDKSVLPLYGRPTYTGSQKWNYYTSTDGYNPQQLPLQNKNRDCLDNVGCTELDDGDLVPIAELGGAQYTVRKYQTSAPKYIP